MAIRRINSLEERDKEFRKRMKSDIKLLIADVIGCPVGTQIVLKDTIQYSIDRYHYKDDNKKFQKYVTVVPDIIEHINLIFPFIDLEGLSLSNTTEEIVNAVINSYYKERLADKPFKAK